MFGQTVGNIEVKPTNILANSNRIISNDTKLTWNETFLLGVYKADLNVALTDKGPLLNQTKYFVAIPLKELFIVVVLISIFTWLYRSARRKNRSS
jgi:hypothetical protein